MVEGVSTTKCYFLQLFSLGSNASSKFSPINAFRGYVYPASPAKNTHAAVMGNNTSASSTKIVVNITAFLFFILPLAGIARRRGVVVKLSLFWDRVASFAKLLV